MDCRTFEREVSRGLTAPADDGPSIAALEEHASTCASCRADGDLLRLVAVAPAERFPFDDPGPARWAEIEARLEARLARERRGSRRDGPAALAASVAAAVLCASLLAGTSWSVRGTAGRPGVATAASPGVLAANPDRPWDADGVPPAGFDWEDPTRHDAGRSAPVPDLEALDGDEREELLEWIRDEMSRIEGDAA